ncbi:hypothetical protein OH492_11345 [Vibrio chagasii]|nr:hypothetical protein [Vibrio chagasii]
MTLTSCCLMSLWLAFDPKTGKRLICKSSIKHKETNKTIVIIEHRSRMFYTAISTE